MKLWHACFEELNDYKKMYGDCLVPYNYQRIHHWELRYALNAHRTGYTLKVNGQI